MKKRLSALLLASVMVFALTACQPAKSDPTPTPDNSTPVVENTTPVEPTKPASTDPLDMITEGYYEHHFSNDGTDYVYFFHFYENDPVLGSVFYAGLNNNRGTFVGTYTVEKKDCAYSCYPDRETKLAKEGKVDGTAPYTVTFFDWDGNELGKVGFDGDTLYNTMDEGDVISFAGSGTVYYVHDTENKFASAYEGELGIPYLEYIADEEATSTLAINHNKTYTDLVASMVEGTWTVEKNAEGGLDFKLTPTESFDTGATVSTSANKATCTYTPDGGEAIKMSAPGGGPQIAYTFTGTHTIAAYNMDAEVALNLMGDNTCIASVSLQGNSIEIATGTYELVDGYKFHFTFDGGTEADSKVDGTGTMTMQLVVADAPKVGDVDSTLTLVKDDPEPELVYTFAGKHTIASANTEADVTLELYSDNTCAATVNAFGNVMDLASGTYKLDGYTFTFNFDGLDEVKSSVDGTGTVTMQLTVAGTRAGDVDSTLTLQK